MYCKNCGAQIDSGSKFCTSCGTSLTGSATPSEKPAKSAHNNSFPDKRSSKEKERRKVILIVSSAVLFYFSILSGIGSNIFCLIFLVFAPEIFWCIYNFSYFRSKKFKSAKSNIQGYIQDCNNLNSHIEELKNTAIVVNRSEFGHAEYRDTSAWSMKRPELSKRLNAPNVYSCSRVVCDNAKNDPFKYICKYFGVSADEETLLKFEAILNNFEAAEEGKISLENTKNDILDGIKKDVPWLIRFLAKDKLEEKLGFENVDMSKVHFQKYIFQYISPGGNASTTCEITMDIQNLNDFVMYLSEKVKFRKSAAGQRALMTSRLRAFIKDRDGHTCKNCGVSVLDEPHLLLEVDHIVPVSRGGLTTEENLQTLCWRCNRSKGAKM